MSQENVATLERLGDAFRCAEWDAVAATFDPDILVRADPRWPEPRFYGREAYVTFLRGAWEAWGPDFHVEEVVDLGDRVLTRSRWSIRGQHSGVAGEFRVSSISTFRDGRVVFTEFFIDHDQALKAVGLED